jgi:hypothetical protein
MGEGLGDWDEALRKNPHGVALLWRCNIAATKRAGTPPPEGAPARSLIQLLRRSGGRARPRGVRPLRRPLRPGGQRLYGDDLQPRARSSGLHMAEDGQEARCSSGRRPARTPRRLNLEREWCRVGRRTVAPLSSTCLLHTRYILVLDFEHNKGENIPQC